MFSAPNRMNKDGYTKLAKLKLLDQRHNLGAGVYLSGPGVKDCARHGASVVTRQS